MLFRVMRYPGFATAEGTHRLKLRLASADSSHFRSAHGLNFSSIGLGTYLGDSSDDADALYSRAIETAWTLGCNVLDTAVNYRCQRSERAIGMTLARALDNNRIKRDEIIVCTKGGYLYFDGQVPQDAGRYVAEQFINTGLSPYDEIAGGCHCLHPNTLTHSLQTSLNNLGLETVDVYYLHNPEQQLDAIDRPLFLKRMERAFLLLEERCRQNQIRYYGIATWNGLRVSPTSNNFLSLETLCAIAQQAGGHDHHFRFIQLPYNLSMPEAFVFKNQPVGGEARTVLEAAKQLGLSVISSASLLQSRLAALPEGLAGRIADLATSAQRAIQFARSTPGITTALTGMKQEKHVRENLLLAQKPLLALGALEGLFNKTVKP